MKNLLTYVLFCLLLACQPDQEKDVSSVSIRAATPEKRSDDRTYMAGNDFLIDDQHSYIGFKIKYFGFSPVRGRFNEFDGRVFYNPEKLADLSVTIFVKVNTINTGNERRDNDLITGEGWMKENQYPFIVFESTSLEENADGSFKLTGDFTLNGITKSLIIPFDRPTPISRDWAANEQVDFSGRVTINRKDFGVVGADFWDSVMENGLTQLSDEVEIELDIHCRRPDYLKRYEELEEGNVRKVILDEIKGNGIEAGLVKLASIKKKDEKAITSGALVTIGNTLRAWGKREEAIKVFNWGVQIFPDRTSLMDQLGITHLIQNNILEAKTWFEKSLILDPANSRAFEYLRLLENRGNHSEISGRSD